MVPDDPFYDSYRDRFLAIAGGVASRYAQFPNGGMFSVGQDDDNRLFAWLTFIIDHYALSLTSDPTGEIREQEAWALGSSQAKTAASLTLMGIMFTHDWPDDRIEKLRRT